MRTTTQQQQKTSLAHNARTGSVTDDTIVAPPWETTDAIESPASRERTAADRADVMFYIASAFVLAGSLFAAVYRHGIPSMWLDEASSWHNVRGGWSRLMSYCVGGDDSSGFAYANLLKLWTLAFGAESEGTMRWLSALLVVAFVGVMLHVGCKLWGRREALCIAILAAAHPEVIFWSRQIRTYALVLLATSLCLWGLVVYLQSPAERRRQKLLIAGSCLLVASHLFGFFFVCGMVAFLAAYGWLESPQSQRLRQAANTAAPLKWAVVLGLGWALVMRSRIQDSLNDFWIGGTMGDNALHVLTTLLPIVSMWSMMLLIGLAVLSRRRDAKSQTILLGFSAIALPVVLGPLAATLLAHGDHNFVHPRYAISLIPLLLLPMGYCLARIPYRAGAAVAIVVAACALYASGIGRLYRPDAPWGDDTRAATQYLNTHAQPNDVAMLLPWCERIAFEYYGLTIPLEGAPRDDLAQCLGTWTERWQAKPPRRDWAAQRVWLILIHGEPRRTYADLDLSAFPQEQFGALRVVRIDEPRAHAPKLVERLSDAG